DAAEIVAMFQQFRARPASRTRSWVCFYLARALGKVPDAAAAKVLMSSLTEDPAEAAGGMVDPPNVFVFRAMTPFYRAAVASALGRMGQVEAGPVLLSTVTNLSNALDVRHSAAEALSRVADAELRRKLREIAPHYPEVSTRLLLLQACESEVRIKSERFVKSTR
ncbi:MAG: hypothetical protein AB1813_19240, partial [Verrucomicrobiota bacterium]